MLPQIGIMMGFYILTRMLSLGLRKGEREEPKAVQIMAMITIIVTLFMMLLLFSGGMSAG